MTCFPTGSSYGKAVELLPLIHNTMSVGIPVDRYFCLNSLHSTYLIHDVVAQELGKTLSACPNVY